jgi:hypothetical protein
MKTFAVIKEGLVYNKILADSQSLAESLTGLTAVDITDRTEPLNPGWAYDGSQFIEPEEVVVEEVVEETP